MWLTSYMAKNIKGKSITDKGRVTGVRNSKVTLEGSSGYRNLSLIAPYGIVAIPEKGEQGLVAHTDGGEVFMGVIMKEDNTLMPGEIMLCSSGGASIVLKNNGQVIINGKVFGGD